MFTGAGFTAAGEAAQIELVNTVTFSGDGGLVAFRARLAAVQGGCLAAAGPARPQAERVL